jgi:hypothetical protein
MKILLLSFLMIYSIPYISNCQIQSFVEFDSLYEIDAPIVTRDQVSIYKNDLFFASNSKSKKFLRISNLSKNINYDLHLPDTISFHPCRGFIISEDIIYYYDYRLIHAFSLSNKNPKHLFSTNKRGCVRSIKVIQDKLYLYGVAYCSFNTDTDKQTAINIFDLFNKNREFLEFPNPSARGFSYFQPSKVIEIDSNRVFIADYDKYRILIYDYDRSLVDSINYSPTEWISTDEIIPEYPVGSHEPASYIKKISPFTNKISLMNNISLLSNNRLLVAWTIPKDEDYEYIMRYDIWKKVDGEWEISKSNIEDFIPVSGKIMDEYSLPIKMGFKVVDDYLIVRYRGSTKKIFLEYIDKPYEEFHKANEKHFLENDLKTLVGVYKIK